MGCAHGPEVYVRSDQISVRKQPSWKSQSSFIAEGWISKGRDVFEKLCMYYTQKKKKKKKDRKGNKYCRTERWKKKGKKSHEGKTVLDRSLVFVGLILHCAIFMYIHIHTGFFLSSIIQQLCSKNQKQKNTFSPAPLLHRTYSLPLSPRSPATPDSIVCKLS